MKAKQTLPVSLALVLAACSTNGAADKNELPSLNSPAGIAMNMVADRTGALWEDVYVISEEAMDFRDSSLGCPEAGRSYLQVITPGHKVIAEYDGQTYDVRVAGDRAKICDAKAPEQQPRPSM